MARQLGLDGDLERPVQELSGGQQQRVALGRCLLRQAPICLLDEPLGHLDAPLRVEMRRLIRVLAREQGVTLIHVTHDPEEALAVGDQVAVMQDGRIVQIDEPAALRQAPRNRWIAELVHQQQGGLNIVAGSIARVGDSLRSSRRSAAGPCRAPRSCRKWSLSANHKNSSPQATGRIHMIFAIAAGAVRCDDGRHQDADEIRLTMPVLQRECSSAGTWIIAGDSRGRWIGRGHSDQGAEATMTFAMERGFWFDSVTGQTMCAPAG